MKKAMQNYSCFKICVKIVFKRFVVVNMSDVINIYTNLDIID